MAGKMTGSPYHVETRQYKYATEKSEVPVAKSEFNLTITRCSRCAYYCIVEKTFVCTNTSVLKHGDHHCMGYLDSKSVPDLTAFKNRVLTKFKSFESHQLIDSVVEELKKYTYGSSELIDAYDKVIHGKSSDLNCYLSTGKHTIKLQKFDDPKLFVEKEIRISNNISTVNLDFEVNRKAINITDYKTSSKKLSASYVSFLRQKGSNTTGYSFNTDEMRFSYYSKTSPSYGKNDWSEKGAYTVDSNGFVTLMFDNGTVEYFRCEAVLYSNNNPEEALLPVTGKTMTVGPRAIDDSAFVRK